MGAPARRRPRDLAAGRADALSYPVRSRTGGDGYVIARCSPNAVCICASRRSPIPPLAAAQQRGILTGPSAALDAAALPRADYCLSHGPWGAS